ncbi:MAG: ATP-binding protein [bacterium]|jgi:predicted AAA+ superfamily ATPase
MDIIRMLEADINKIIGRNKVILVFGTRRVGKTYLINKVSEKYTGQKLMLNAEDFDVQEMLSKRTIANYNRMIGNAKLLIVDEAQSIPDIGSILKLMIDTQPELTIIATGSSSLDLVNKTGEPLTGRQYTFNLFPISQLELGTDPLSVKSNFDERMILGSYPEIFQLNSMKEKEDYLKELIRSYLLKDILSFAGIKHSNKLIDLLRLIAFQVGSVVSYNELSTKLGINKITVEHYLDLLQKVFIIFKLPSYSTNLRNEVAKGVKWYFYDNGIRNAIINDFRILTLRNDVGALWENYIISERIKRNAYKGEDRQMYFWRNYLQKEIDLIEIHHGTLDAYEIKYGLESRIKIPLAFHTAYPDASFTLINRDTYLDFIT